MEHLDTNTSCSDSPLSIASNTVGFMTALIALAIASYGFHSIFVSAPKAFQEFMSELKQFQHQLGSMKVELSREAEAAQSWNTSEASSRLKAIEQDQLSAQAARVEAAETLKDARMIAESANWISRARVDHDRPPSNAPAIVIAVETARSGFMWWWSHRDKAHEIMSRIAWQRTNLLVLERSIMRRRIFAIQEDLQSARDSLHSRFDYLEARLGSNTRGL